MAFRPLFLAVLIASTRSANALEAETSAEASQSMATAGRTHGGKADLKVDPYFCDIYFVEAECTRNPHCDWVNGGCFPKP
mmetsp:Transcript_72874/g.190127  ORF Transcript_72874/g.190127 Transcript_72874/m.190127 type:complete len:80 (+) Transcript_72874:107-346(+)